MVRARGPVFLCLIDATRGRPETRRCYLFPVRRLMFVTALLVSLAAVGPAHADWEVHRTNSSALLERAERALLERPDDDELARRLVRLVGRDGRMRLRERFRARADRAATD